MLYPIELWVQYHANLNKLPAYGKWILFNFKPLKQNNNPLIDIPLLKAGRTD
jgi:hypothetical protein